MRLLIAHHQLGQVRADVVSSKEPVVISDATGRILFWNESFSRLFRRPHVHLEQLEDLAALFTEPLPVRSTLSELRSERAAWRGELELVVSDRDCLPVGVRADVITGYDGAVLGYVVILDDLTDRKNAEVARRHFENSIQQAEHADSLREPGSLLLRESDEVISAIIANANVAAMEIADASDGVPVAPLLKEIETSTRRAAALYRQLRAYSRRS